MTYTPELTHAERRARRRQMANRVRRLQLEGSCSEDAMHAVASEFDVHPHTVRRAMAENGVRWHKKRSSTTARVIRLLVSGISVQNTADLCGITRQRVHQICKDCGVTPAQLRSLR